MDIRGCANAMSDSVNPNMPVTIQASTGYTTGGV